jgi:hypothetical protein
MGSKLMDESIPVLGWMKTGENETPEEDCRSLGDGIHVTGLVSLTFALPSTTLNDNNMSFSSPEFRDCILLD